MLDLKLHGHDVVSGWFRFGFGLGEIRVGIGLDSGWVWVGRLRPLALRRDHRALNPKPFTINPES